MAELRARLTLERRLTLTDAQLALGALAVLPHQGARAGAEALVKLCEQYGLRRVEELITPWLRANGKAD